MKYARIEDGTVIEVFVPQEGFSLDESFPPSHAAMFSEVPDNVTAGSVVDSKGKWTIAAPPPDRAPLAIYQKVSPMTFQMLFTSPERITIRAKVASPDAVLADWWDIVTSPQLTEVDLGLSSVQQALDYLVTINVINEDRKAQILAAQIQ